MIAAEDVAGVVVTRGDVNLTDVLKPLEPLGEVVVWNNALDENLAVYGRYAAIEHTDKPVILVVDDDVALSTEAVDGLLAAYEPGRIVANMPPEFRHRYTDSCLVGFGAIFDREVPALAFRRLGFDGRQSPFIEDEWERYQSTSNGVTIQIPDAVTLRRTCDIVFTTLTPRILVDLPFTMLPWTWGPKRMYKTTGNTEERKRMLSVARQVRDAQRVA